MDGLEKCYCPSLSGAGQVYGVSVKNLSETTKERGFQNVTIEVDSSPGLVMLTINDVL